MAGEAVPEVLDGTHLADRLSRAELRKVVRAGQRVTVPQGWSFIWEHTPGDAAYLLLDGRVAVWHERERIAELGPGDIVGEAALRRHQLRTATVSALEPLVMLRFGTDTFAELIDRMPRFAEAVDANVAERVKRSPDPRS
jgi:CRP-like cAMP-binding protein